MVLPFGRRGLNLLRLTFDCTLEVLVEEHLISSLVHIFPGYFLSSDKSLFLVNQCISLKQKKKKKRKHNLLKSKQIINKILKKSYKTRDDL